VDILQRSMPPGGFGHILDVGCGDGLLFDRLRVLGSVEGLEPDPQTISPDTLYQACIHRCAFDEYFEPKKQYGLILMLDVLEHLSDPVTAVRKVESLLAPGGFFLATVPAFQLLWTNHDVINHHVRRYTRGTLREVIKTSRLRICKERYWFHWIFFPKLLSRFLEHVLRTQPKNPTVPPAWLNRSLYLFSRLEYATLERLCVPFGSSVVMMAQKAF